MDGLEQKNVLVGAGGWHEYTTNRHDLHSISLSKLKKYSNEFDFVEINTTFYSIYYPPVLERWRKAVPDNFEFSVKCYRGLTHKIGLRPDDDAYRVLHLMRRYCDILKSKILVMQMPPGLKLDTKFVQDAAAFFKSVDLGDLRIAFEFRVMPEKMPSALVAMLRDFNFIHTVDLTFEDPRLESDLLYSRVFGRPEKNNALDNKDLDQIRNKVKKSKSSEVRVVGHSQKIIEDTRKIKETLEK